MKVAFDKIKAQLENPFFELQLLGKEAIRQRTFPLEKYREPPVNFLFIDWTAEDNQEVIQYSFVNTQFGRVLLANTRKGICFLGFVCETDDKITADLQSRFPRQLFEEKLNTFQQLAIDYCNGDQQQIIPLHLKGTSFQLDIWKKLTRIPEGKLATYGSLSSAPKAAQAVGSAVGKNPVSYIIPCHRIVKNDGNFQGYHWGTELKKQLLAYELQSSL